jgi:hypothetical protein
MRVTVDRSGGFAGIKQTKSVSTDAMPPEDAEKLKGLVNAAGFFELPPAIRSTEPSADSFQYKVTVEADRGTHVVQVGEAEVPPSLRPVLDWVTNSPQK